MRFRLARRKPIQIPRRIDGRAHVRPFRHVPPQGARPGHDAALPGMRQHVLASAAVDLRRALTRQAEGLDDEQGRCRVGGPLPLGLRPRLPPCLVLHRRPRVPGRYGRPSPASTPKTDVFYDRPSAARCQPVSAHPVPGPFSRLVGAPVLPLGDVLADRLPVVACDALEEQLLALPLAHGLPELLCGLRDRL